MRAPVRQAEAIWQEPPRVPGVAGVDILGEQAEQAFVELPHELLAALGLSVPDIALALHCQNAVAPAESVDTPGPRIVLRFDGEDADLDALAATPSPSGGGW